MFSQPLPSPGVNARAASTVFPLSGHVLVPFASLTSSSLRGLVSVDPFTEHRAPSRGPGPPPDRAGGQRALPRLDRYYESSDSSEGIASPFPIGLWLQLPTPPPL